MPENSHADPEHGARRSEGCPTPPFNNKDSLDDISHRVKHSRVGRGKSESGVDAYDRSAGRHRKRGTREDAFVPAKRPRQAAVKIVVRQHLLVHNSMSG